MNYKLSGSPASLLQMTWHPLQLILITIRKFIDREAEQDILYREWNSDGGRLIIIYGRRRIGKTRLISEFIKEKSGVIFFAEEVPVRLQIEGFKSEVAGYLKDDLLLSLTIKSWSEFFTYLLKNPPEKRSYLIIDEFRIKTGQYFNFDFNKYFGKKYEYFIRKEIAPSIFPGSQIGRWWHKGEEIDLIAVNHDTRTVVFGECKYGTKSATECLKILGRLEKKSELVKINDDYRKKYALFAGEIKDKNKINNTDYLIYDQDDLLVYLR